MIIPDVSIVIPFYDEIDLLSRTIDSVLSQEFPGLGELIIALDSSSRFSRGYIANLASQANRTHQNTNFEIVVMRSGLPNGPAFTRREGLAKSRGHFVTFLDADDVYLPGKIRTQVTAMLASNASLSYHFYWQQIGTNRILRRSPLVLDGAQMASRLLLGIMPIATPSIMIRREHFPDLLGKFVQDNLPGEDYRTWANLAMSAVGDIILVPQSLCVVHVRLDSASRKLKKASLRTAIMKHVAIRRSLEGHALLLGIRPAATSGMTIYLTAMATALSELLTRFRLNYEAKNGTNG